MIDIYDVTCSKCTHGVFCDSWGEWKCNKLHKRIYDPVMLDCRDFEKRKKDEPMPDCQCETCMTESKNENDN